MGLTCRTESIGGFDVLYVQKALVSLTCCTEGIGEFDVLYRRYIGKFDVSYRRHW